MGPPGNYISGNGAGNELQRNDVIPPGKAGPETRRHCSPVQGKTGKKRKTRGKWGKPKKNQGKPGENGKLVWETAPREGGILEGWEGVGMELGMGWGLWGLGWEWGEAQGEDGNEDFGNEMGIGLGIRLEMGIGMKMMGMGWEWE